MAVFDDLPIELLPFVFKYLGIKDLIKARSVSKIWKYLCDKQRVQELVIKCKEDSEIERKWYHTNIKIEHDNLIQMDVFDTKYNSFVTQVLKLNQLKELKRLMICGSSAPSGILAHIHCFSQLVQLDCNFYFKGDFFEATISHSNIQILCFRTGVYDEDRLEVNAENLKVLKIEGDYDCVRVIWPESIIKLEAQIYGHQDRNSKLVSFRNLEIINSCTNRIDPIILTQLPHLKTFNFLTHEHYNTDDELVSEFEQFMSLEQSILNLIQMKDALGKTDFKILFDDIELTTIEQSRQILSQYYPDMHVNLNDDLNAAGEEMQAENANGVEAENPAVRDQDMVMVD